MKLESRRQISVDLLFSWLALAASLSRTVARLLPPTGLIFCTARLLTIQILREWVGLVAKSARNDTPSFDNSRQSMSTARLPHTCQPSV